MDRTRVTSEQKLSLKNTKKIVLVFHKHFREISHFFAKMNNAKNCEISGKCSKNSRKSLSFHIFKASN